MHYRMFFSSEEWFTASDLFDDRTGKTFELTLTIARVTKGKLVGVGGKKSTKPALHWKESDHKPLAVGAKNCASIAQACGGSSMRDWVGKQVTLFVGEDKISGEMRPCVRIRAFRPEQQRAARGDGPARDHRPSSSRGSAPPPRDDGPPPNEPPSDAEQAAIRAEEIRLAKEQAR